VSNNQRRICLTAVTAVVATLAACQTDQQDRSSPGALPSAKSTLTPTLNAATYAAHGELLERRGDYARAVRQFQKALELEPEMVAARNRLGVTLNKLGRHQEASAEFRRALLRQPGAPYLHNNLGFSLYLEGDLLAAENKIARALELDPDFRRAQMNYGLVLAKLGRYDEAVTYFVKAVGEADAHYNVAVIQSEAGEYVAAAHSLERALDIDPNLSAAREQLRYVARYAAAEEAARLAAEEAEAARLAAEQAEAERLAAERKAEEYAIAQEAAQQAAERRAAEEQAARAAAEEEQARRVAAAQAAREAAELERQRKGIAAAKVTDAIKAELERVKAEEAVVLRNAAAQIETERRVARRADEAERGVVQVIDEITPPPTRVIQMRPMPSTFSPTAPPRFTAWRKGSEPFPAGTAQLWGPPAPPIDPESEPRAARVLSRLYELQVTVGANHAVQLPDRLYRITLAELTDEFLFTLSTGGPWFDDCLNLMEQYLDHIEAQPD
jgi:Flp pilus assembly protein TadD